MNKLNLMLCVLAGIAIFFWMAMPVSAGTSAVIGETVQLSGKGGGYDEMYLFLTGPNLAPGGVRLDSVMSPVVSGTPSSFTRASVSDGVWEYDWNTGRMGGTLDAGTYLVWVSPEPLDRNDVLGTPYATIGVTLTRPGLTAEISGENGREDALEGDATTAMKSPDDSAEETLSHSAVHLSGDGPASQEIPAVQNEVQETPGDMAPVPTTAGSALYPLVCAAGCGIIFLCCTGYARKEI